VLLLFLASNTESGDGTSLKATRFNRLFTILAGTEGAFVHSRKGFINFAEKLALSVTEFKD
jgi:hypothetical protein